MMFAFPDSERARAEIRKVRRGHKSLGGTSALRAKDGTLTLELQGSTHIKMLAQAALEPIGNLAAKWRWMERVESSMAAHQEERKGEALGMLFDALNKKGRFA